MTTIQYIFCAIYAICAAGMICIIAMQSGEEMEAFKSLSGASNESYYAKNMAHSAEAKKKRFTAMLSIGFSFLTIASMFVLP